MITTDPQPIEVEQLPLKSLGLKAGMALQTRRLVEGASKKEAQYYGAIEGKGFMVAPLGADGANMELTSGEVCVVRGFTGQYEFSFIGRVLQTFHKPFSYALLTYPEHVDARKVRQSMRTKVAWPCRISLANGQAQSEPDVTMVDLSPHGAMVRSATPIGSISAKLTLHIAAQLGATALHVHLQASICHNNRSTDDATYFTGMAFFGLNAQDQQLLTQLMQGASAENRAP